jgi:hypothetical protein
MNGQGPKPEIIAEFKNRRKRQIIAVIPAVVAIGPIVVFSDAPTTRTMLGIPAAVALPIAFALLVGVLIFSFRNWRCPACRGYLGKAMNPRFCQKCGVQLR